MYNSLFIVPTSDHTSLYLLPFPFSFHRFLYLNFLYPHSYRSFLKYVNVLVLKYSPLWNFIHCHLPRLVCAIAVFYLGHNYHVQWFIYVAASCVHMLFARLTLVRRVVTLAFVRGSRRPVYPAPKYYYPPSLPGLQVLSTDSRADVL
jgi:hypothetical protein